MSEPNWDNTPWNAPPGELPSDHPDDCECRCHHDPRCNCDDCIDAREARQDDYEQARLHDEF